MEFSIDKGFTRIDTLQLKAIIHFSADQIHDLLGNDFFDALNNFLKTADHKYISEIIDILISRTDDDLVNENVAIYKYGPDKTYSGQRHISHARKPLNDGQVVGGVDGDNIINLDEIDQGDNFKHVSFVKKSKSLPDDIMFKPVDLKKGVYVDKQNRVELPAEIFDFFVTLYVELIDSRSEKYNDQKLLAELDKFFLLTKYGRFHDLVQDNFFDFSQLTEFNYYFPKADDKSIMEDDQQEVSPFKSQFRDVFSSKLKLVRFYEDIISRYTKPNGNPMAQKGLKNIIDSLGNGKLDQSVSFDWSNTENEYMYYLFKVQAFMSVFEIDMKRKHKIKLMGDNLDGFLESISDIIRSFPTKIGESNINITTSVNSTDKVESDNEKLKDIQRKLLNSIFQLIYKTKDFPVDIFEKFLNAILVSDNIVAQGDLDMAKDLFLESVKSKQLAEQFIFEANEHIYKNDDSSQNTESSQDNESSKNAKIIKDSKIGVYLSMSNEEFRDAMQIIDLIYGYRINYRQGLIY